ncbi:VOC family protein [Nitratireductor sp.]|uniref:VOC family protein n=1 Tax=Nitratireductor sp. TaxID=1872084 RepID=UPI0025EDF8C7|nr:VOC family protein [Nitratireductor sp.]
MASFAVGGQHYRGLEAGPPDAFNHSFSIIIECDTQAEIDRLWAALGESGTIEQCGWLKDRWGLSWQILPKQLGELMNDPDPARAQRITEAMLQMVKLDIAALEAAASR